MAATAATRLTIGRDSANVLCIDGAMPERGGPPKPKQRGGAAARADPFPQALDAQPDNLVASLPQVAADSKPKLAETVGVMKLPPPMLAAATRTL